MKYYLGIDIGTSGTKAVCFDRTGTVVCSKTVDYELYTDQPGYAEQNPEDWFHATKKVITAIVKEGYPITGIGFSGQMHGLVLLDKQDKILRRSIIWCDNRAIEETAILKQELTDSFVKEITGNEVVSSFTLAKLLWVKRNEPDLYKKIDKIFLPKDYVRYMLTKSFTTEYSDASGMQLLDIRKKRYAKELLEYLDLKEEQLPALKESVEISGYIQETLWKELGLNQPCFCVGGAGDQAAAALGNGILHKGDVSLVLGSSGVVFSPIEQKDIYSTSLQVFMHAVPNTYHVMGVTNGCGLSYKWIKETFYLNNTYEDLNQFASQADPCSKGLVYLPYLNGERTPHMDPYASGGFIGIRQNTGKEEIIRSVLEGISYSLKDCFSLLPKADYKVHLTGGGAKSSLWCEILASILNTNIYRLKNSEGGALGVAMLAMVAGKEYDSIEEAVQMILNCSECTTPNLEWKEKYESGYELYRALYPSLKNYYPKAFKI